MSKGLKIGLIVGLVILAIVLVWYFLFRTPAAGNAYASAATLSAIKGDTNNSQYGTEASSPWPATDADNAANAILTGTYPGTSFGNGGVYGHAWTKGMNIAYTAANVNQFATDIKNYGQNASLRKPNWQVAVGEFLTA